MREQTIQATPLAQGTQHFFGYYDKSQFDISGRYLLGLKCDVIGRLQQPEDVATIGLVDLENGNQWNAVAQTTAWNWQMGCMAEWIPGSSRNWASLVAERHTNLSVRVSARWRCCVRRSP